jgi:DNA-binding response OmpR family regulator
MREVVLVIEDEAAIVDFLERGLESHGFEVRAALDGLSGTQRALAEDVDVVVLDMMLPQRSGHEVLADLRKAKPALPVIVLTARGDVDDRVAGLDSGAVDYMTKPFSLKELAARIRAQLRAAAQTTTTTLTTSDITIDLITREVRRAEQPVRLSATEFDLLVYMVRNRGRVLPRQELLRAVWGYSHDPGTNVVDVYIGYLRRKLGDARDPITTIRSVGYRLDETD